MFPCCSAAWVRVLRLLDRHAGTRHDLLVDENRSELAGLSALLARLGGVDELSLCRRFPHRAVSASGKVSPRTDRRATLAVAGTPALAGAANPAGAGEGSKRVDLSLDTTFLHSHDRSQGRHHEILIGHGRSASGERQVIGTLLGKQAESSERVSACLACLGRTPTTEITAFTDGDNTRDYRSAPFQFAGRAETSRPISTCMALG